MTISTDGTAMAKVQKTFLIPEELSAIIDRVLELSGMNFTKFATAALLQHLFDGCLQPEHGMSFSGDAMWTDLASRLERGKINVGSIPTELLKNAVYMAKHPLDDPEHHRLASENADWLTLQKRLLRDRQRYLQSWNEAVNEKKGELPAILAQMEGYFSGGR